MGRRRISVANDPLQTYSEDIRTWAFCELLEHDRRKNFITALPYQMPLITARDIGGSLDAAMRTIDYSGFFNFRALLIIVMSFQLFLPLD